MFWCALLCVHSSFCNHLNGEENAACVALFVFLVSRDCCMVLPQDGMGLSAVCDCGNSLSYSLTIFNINSWYVPFHHLVQEHQPLLVSFLFLGGQFEVNEHVCYASLLSGLF